jgi:hypothetical protein
MCGSIAAFDGVVSSTISAFAGASFAFALAAWHSQRTERHRYTQSLVDEYFSQGFQKHRIAINELSELIRKGEASVEALAGGFWYPGSTARWEGPVSHGLTQHEHLEAFLNFIIRVHVADQLRRLDRQLVKQAISTSYEWEAGLVEELAHEARKQVEAAGRVVRLPAWVTAVEHLKPWLAGHRSDIRSVGT